MPVKRILDFFGIPTKPRKKKVEPDTSKSWKKKLDYQREVREGMFGKDR